MNIYKALRLFSNELEADTENNPPIWIIPGYGYFRDKFKELAFKLLSIAPTVRIVVNFGSLNPESIYLGSLSDIAWEPCNKKDFYSKNFQIGKIENGKNKIIQISNKNILNRL